MSSCARFPFGMLTRPNSPDRKFGILLGDQVSQQSCGWLGRPMERSARLSPGSVLMPALQSVTGTVMPHPHSSNIHFIYVRFEAIVTRALHREQHHAGRSEVSDLHSFLGDHAIERSEQARVALHCLRFRKRSARLCLSRMCHFELGLSCRVASLHLIEFLRTHRFLAIQVFVAL